MATGHYAECRRPTMKLNVPQRICTVSPPCHETGLPRKAELSRLSSGNLLQVLCPQGLPAHAHRVDAAAVIGLVVVHHSRASAQLGE